MIKRKSIEGYSGELISGSISLLIGLGILFYLEVGINLGELIEQIGEVEVALFILLGYIFAAMIIVAGVSIVIEVISKSKHPERYKYCRKCKRIIRIKKGIFCGDCLYSIEKSLERDNEKYFQDYKKNNKERYKKLKNRLKKKK